MSTPRTSLLAALALLLPAAAFVATPALAVTPTAHKAKHHAVHKVSTHHVVHKPAAHHTVHKASAHHTVHTAPATVHHTSS